MIDFDTLQAGASANRTLTISNTGNLPLKVYLTTIGRLNPVCGSDPCSPSDASAFFVIDDRCVGNTVSVDGNCTITVEYAPTSAISYAGALMLTTNSQYGALTILLSGNATTAIQANAASDNDPQTQSASSATGPKTGSGTFGPMETFLIAFAWLSLGLVRPRH